MKKWYIPVDPDDNPRALLESLEDAKNWVDGCFEPEGYFIIEGVVVSEINGRKLIWKDYPK